MAITATAARTPPTMPPVFGLLPPEDEKKDGSVEGTPVKLAEVEKVPVGMVMTEPGLPINEPGPISGLSEKRRFEATKERAERKNPTTDGQRFVGVPLILELAWIISTCCRSCIPMLVTNCDVEESPLRYTCSRRDGARKAGARLSCQRQCFTFFAEVENSRRRRQSLCAIEYIFGPPNGRYMRED